MPFILDPPENSIPIIMSVFFFYKCKRVLPELLVSLLRPRWCPCTALAPSTWAFPACPGSQVLGSKLKGKSFLFPFGTLLQVTELPDRCRIPAWMSLENFLTPLSYARTSQNVLENSIPKKWKRFSQLCHQVWTSLEAMGGRDAFCTSYIRFYKQTNNYPCRMSTTGHHIWDQDMISRFCAVPKGWMSLHSKNILLVYGDFRSEISGVESVLGDLRGQEWFLLITTGCLK